MHYMRKNKKVNTKELKLRHRLDIVVCKLVVGFLQHLRLKGCHLSTCCCPLLDIINTFDRVLCRLLRLGQSGGSLEHLSLLQIGL